MNSSATPERFSVMTGLILVMLASLPRYALEGHETRLTLLLMAAGVVAVAASFHWRMLEGSARRQLPGLLKRLLACLLGGGLAIAVWQLISLGGVDAILLLSHGAALGLLIHVVSLLWRRPAAD
ncbi:hypothetical protein SAMN05216571_103278 [Onishia taeanensis]|uniref:Transmembrane protein n=1 Tax=Onishia taeanensis TaxID=284577 RepID=A0A1G7QIJ0_9GAMM|nr:hypothetical protein [Halomonas taeanensis]SDF98333.1 hypothetical protein SAMN05216571_103278 [Halomonas taeanensis]